MKKILITLVLLTFVVLISPKLIGNIVETEHQAAMDMLNENPSITVNSTTYNRQWFKGQASTEITVLIDGEEIPDIKLTIEEDLSFGPFIFTDSGVKFALSYSQASIHFIKGQVDEELATFIKDNVHLSALLTFSNNIETTLAVDEVSKEIDGNKITSAKALGKFTLENNNRFYGDFTWPGLRASKGEKSLIVQTLTFSIDQTLIAGNYYQGNAISIGDFNFELSSIMANDNTGKAVLTLDKLLINANTSVQDDLMKINMNYQAGKVASVAQVVENANLAISFNRFNIEVLQDFNTLMSSLSAEGEAMLSSENLEKMSELIEKLLLDEPTVEITDFSLQTPQGKVASSMQISIDRQLFDKTNMMSIMAAVNVNGEGKAPKAFFDKLGLSPMVEMYINQGLIILKESELSFKLNYAQGRLEVNGNIIAL